MKAILNRIRISSKKANLAASLVRKEKATHAVDILKYTPKKSAKILRKVIESAIANAQTNNKQNKENLYIKEIIVTEGPTYKRSIPVSRGRANPRLKRTANITVKLETIGVEKPLIKKTKEVVVEPNEPKVKKSAPKKEKKSNEKK